MFIGRDRELKEIKYHLSTPGFECIFIHGQRHMGKTSRHFDSWTPWF